MTVYIKIANVVRLLYVSPCASMYRTCRDKPEVHGDMCFMSVVMFASCS